MEYQVTTHDVNETIALGNKIGLLVKPGFLITLEGDLGAGKTMFTKGIGQGLGVKSIINSPTFTIMKEYVGHMPLYHFDAYRLEGCDDDLGFEEMFDGEGLCVVEWPRFIEDILPNERLEMTIKKIDETTRLFLLNPIGKQYEQLCKEIIK